MSNRCMFTPRKKIPQWLIRRPTGSVRRRLFFDYCDNERNAVSKYAQDKKNYPPNCNMYRTILETVSPDDALLMLQLFMEELFVNMRSSFLRDIYKDRYYVWDIRRHGELFGQFIMSDNDNFRNMKNGTCMIDLCSLSSKYGNDEWLLESLVENYNSHIGNTLYGRECKYSGDILNESDVWNVQCFAADEHGTRTTDIISAYDRFKSGETKNTTGTNLVEIERDRVTSGDDFCLVFRKAFGATEQKYTNICDKIRIMHAILVPYRLLEHCKILT